MAARHHAIAKICSLAFAANGLVLAGCVGNPLLLGDDGGPDAALLDGTIDGTSEGDGSPSDDARYSNDAPFANPPGAVDGQTAPPVPESGPWDAALEGAASDAVACSDASQVCDGGCFAADDPAHCGSCDNDCSKLPHVTGATSCQSGKCSLISACAPGWSDCNGSASDGCETDMTTATHCGSCTTTCTGGTPVCSPSTGGARSCTSGCPASAPMLCGTTCSDTTTDSNNCGGCTDRCTGGMTCQGSKCACPSGSHPCNGQCSSNSATTSCGATSCSTCPAPSGGVATCDGTSCGQSCTNTQQSLCGSGTSATCVTLLSDKNNCGTCNNSCGAGQCSSGTCQICGDGLVTGTEECDPKGAGFNAFNCSPECTKITSYTECGPNWPPCLGGTVCGNLGQCTKMCSATSDCDLVAGYPGLMIYCPVPKGNQCIISCMTNQDCPPNSICNGGQTCAVP